MLHLPIMDGMCSHGTPDGQGTVSVHGPLQVALSHEDTGVGFPVRVGGGEAGTQVQAPVAASAVH